MRRAVEWGARSPARFLYRRGVAGALLSGLGARSGRALGIVRRGIVARAPTIAQGILCGLKSIIDGRIGACTEMCEPARQLAYDLRIEHAIEVVADAVVGLHCDASEVVGRESATQVLCYGTAVVIEPLPRS